jgi:chemosensory pili system protein ChpA (sensor histidine kinase/response regulator)
MTDISSQTLHLVAKELSITLADAREALEAYAERPEQRELLEKCAEHLHLAHGVLRLVEVYGAALLTEEMEQVTRYLIDSGGDTKRQIDGLDALMRAMVQLPTYLERVLSGGRDLALVLLPLLNDLRSVRGSPLLSEGTLLLLNLKSNQSPQPQPAAPVLGEAPITLTQWARRLRPRFQVGLLGYIRGERAEQNLDIMAKVAEKLEQVATTQPVFQFWWVTGAVIEALRANGLPGNATLKRLLGHADRQIKTLYEIGETRYCENPPIDLLNNLLYYVARSTTSGGRIGSVRASFRLSELLPVDEVIEHERESLSAPSVKLMHTVAAAIKEDLSKVKDVLDIFVRRGGGRIDELAPQLELLKKISDTLGVLGLGALRQRVQHEVSDLSDMLSLGKTPSEEALVKVAGVLLSVEDSLDDQLVRLILPPQREGEYSGSEDLEFRSVSEAVLRECIVNLARIKDAVSAAVHKSGDYPPQGLDNVPQLLRGITAGLLMLGKGRAVELMDAIGTHVRSLVEPGAAPPDALRLERVADAIVSIEYYMETLQSGRNDPWYMLDNAEICINALAEQKPLRVPVAPVASDAGLTQRLDQHATLVAERAAAKELAASAHGSTQPIARPFAAALDPQLLELFIEEAKEEIAAIGSAFPLWDQNPMDQESLATLRRSFHTLKGSGRMVGANLIGEFAWSLENLLNRLLDKTRTRTPGMMSLMRTAVAALPPLVEKLETGRPLPMRVDTLMARANAYAEGIDPEQSAGHVAPEDRAGHSTTLAAALPELPAAQPMPPSAAIAPPSVAVPPEGVPPSTAIPEAAEAPPAVAPTPAAPESAPDLRITFPPPAMDPVLHDIYSKETATHLGEIRNYLRKRTGQSAPHPLPESVYRAIHTLSGSSKMAEARQGVRITEPLNRYMRKVFDSGQGLPDDGLATLAQAVGAIENVVSHIDENSAYFSEQRSLLVQLQQLEAELDAALAHAADVTAMSGVLPSISLAPPDDEFDLEIANIYSEEATELLESAENSLNAWNADRRQRERVAELQRHLHTLKGGARMAGITAMGDLSHELESLVIQIQSGAIPGDDRAHALMQASVDDLGRMRDMVSRGIMPPPATAILSQLRQLMTGEIPPLEAREPERKPPPPPADATEPSRDVREQTHPQGATLPAGLPAAEAMAITPSQEPAAAVPQPVEDPAAHASGMPDAPSFEVPVAETPVEAASLEALPEQPVWVAAASVELPASEATAPAEVIPPPKAEPPAVAQAPAAAAPTETLTPDVAGMPGDTPGLPGREAAPAERTEMARVDAELLDTMLNNAGEVSIFRARLEQQVNSIDFNLAELARTVTRLKEQLRGLEMETEAQVLNRHKAGDSSAVADARKNDFDPLELDRYSSVQQYSRALAETSGDVASIQALLETLAREAQNLLAQQARVITELQNSLMRTRLVPFQRHVQRLTRLVRQTANDTGKRAELSVLGGEAEMDRQVLERMVPALEHMLRNAVVHGIEIPDRRTVLAKPDTGRITVNLERDGAEVVIVVADDGAGIHAKLVRDKAVSLGLVDPDANLSDEEVMQLILEPGFSTAGRVTQAAGRGVGLDVVATEVKKLGGSLFIQSTPGQGSTFTIRLPFTLAISQALIVRVAEEVYALPLATVEGVVRLPKTIVARHLGKDAPLFEYGNQKYRFQQLGAFVGLGASRLPDADVSMAVVLIRAGDHSTALVTDELVGSREIVVKSLGPQMSAIRGIAGATILGDGRVVIILDMGSLVRSEWRARAVELPALDQRDRRKFAIVVDDSITVRRVTQRLLERNGMRVLTAKDGVDALSLLQEHVPDIILLDIEMPRMDGYEVAAHVRSDPRLKGVPIVMITSRVSEKHRAKAIELGVDDYLGKPYQESQLLDAIDPLVNRRSVAAH